MHVIGAEGLVRIPALESDVNVGPVLNLLKPPCLIPELRTRAFETDHPSVPASL